MQPASVIKEGESTSTASVTSPKDYSAEALVDKTNNMVQYSTSKKFPPVKNLPNTERKRILVTGGAGFVGSHLVDRLMLLGHEVTVLDNFFTGSRTTVSDLSFATDRCKWRRSVPGALRIMQGRQEARIDG